MQETALASTDIFNPTPGVSEALGFTPNWSYGGARKTSPNDQTQRPSWGQWFSRSTGVGGYAFDLVFEGRPIEQVRYIHRFYQQFKRGFFTLIDWDNGQREHVGRFTAYSDDTQTANLKYTIRVLFEEIPNVPMRNYPSNWAADAWPLYVLDDSLYQQVAVQSTFVNAWGAQQTPLAIAAGKSAQDPTSYELYNATPAAGDSATVEYVGWGFQMTMRLAVIFGVCNILVDGVQIVTGLDLSSGVAATVSTAPPSPYGTAPVLTPSLGAVLISVPTLSLGRHQVTVVATGAQGMGASGSSVMFPALEVMS
jgi:hypothetical protein